ncbi:pectinesterase [Selaginella moellendorffii]|nr:pectinesterase [Selaginella moellendorffii]XP_024525577.1 pectinesterase [Selaginella moellendorffii]|eukprot:XP_002964772.2 pectinesterase [Selaginella moellendorffii]
MLDEEEGDFELAVPQRPRQGRGGGGEEMAKSDATPSRWKAALLLVLAVAGLGFFAAATSTAGRIGSRRSLLARPGDNRDVDPFIVSACHGTRYPEVCVSSIAADPRSRQGFTSPDQIISLAIDLALQSSSRSFNLTAGIRDRAGGNKNLTAASSDCVQVLGFAINRYEKLRRLGLSIAVVKDFEAWLSGILAYQYDCFSALGYVNSSTEVQRVMLQVNAGMDLISNALSMADAWALYGDNVSSWKPPPSKRELSLGRTRGGEVPVEDLRPSSWIQLEQQRKFSVVVGKSGSFKTIQEAIDSAPSNSKERFSIYIQEGIYDERIYVSDSKTMIMLVGAGARKTIISGNNYVREGVTTMDTATVLVAGDGFVARDLTIRNTAGPELHQAVALRINSDKAVIQSCTLEGYQDTLYSHTNRHYFENCTITGTVDFIFGNAAAFFSNCKLVVRPGRTGVYTSMVTAHGRIDPAQTIGFVFHKCSVETSEEFSGGAPKKLHVYLGRPWKMFSRAVFLDCYLSSSVDPQGWLAWKGDFALDTLLFAEYESYGPGADASHRVPWSTQLNPSQTSAYSAQEFIQGDGWIPKP